MSSKPIVDEQIYPGKTVTFKLSFYDAGNEPYNPTGVTGTVVDGNECAVAVFTLADMTAIEVGVYRYTCTLPADAAAGIWKLKGTAAYTPSGLYSPFVIPFVVAAFQ